MFSWGPDLWQKESQNSRSTSTQHGVQHPDPGDLVRVLDPDYRVRDLSGTPGLMCFLRTNGNAVVVHTGTREDGGRERGRQKAVRWREKIQAVSCGDDVTALLTEGGALLCLDATHTPRPLPVLSATLVSQVSCGRRHSLALTRDGQVFSWGLDSRGQLGLGGSGSRSGSRSGSDRPRKIVSLLAVPLVRVAAGGEQSFAVSFSGGVLAWGRNDVGQLGLGDSADRNTPTAVRSLNAKKSSDVSCGDDHTAVLTKDGVVFTFGGGRHGQLGHNCFTNQLRPRLVAELWGSEVVGVACGSHHTLALTRDGRVFSFGRGDEGQLGREAASHPAVPLPVGLPLGRSIKKIFAAGNCSLATADQEDVRESGGGGVTRRCLDDVIDTWSSDCDAKTRRKNQKEILHVFSSASCLNRSFLERRGDKHFQTSPKFHGLNLPAARRAFKKLLKMDRVVAEVEGAVLCLLRPLEAGPPGEEGLRLYLLLVELLHLVVKRPRGGELAEALAGAIVRLTAENLLVLGAWWSSLTRSAMSRHVTAWKEALAAALSSSPVRRTAAVANLLVVLRHVFQANGRAGEGRRSPDSLFWLQLTRPFLSEDLWLWKWELSEPLIVGKFPFVMNLQDKKFVFDLNAEMTKEAEVNRLNAKFFITVPTDDDLMLVLRLNRESVSEDALRQLAQAGSGSYRRPLGVVFDGTLGPGPRYSVYLKDFFYKVFHELVSPASGMFMFNDSGTLAWFSSNPQPEPRRFFYFGVLCGLALYNGYIVYLPFPLVLFKALLGAGPTLEDMVEFSPCLGGSLRSILLEYDDDVLQELSQDFSVHWDGREVDLDQENPRKPLTSRNKKQFVDAYVEHAFSRSVDGVLEEFRRGFFQVFEDHLVEQFTPEQLREVLVGEEFNQWEALRQNTEYQGGYRDDHPNIQMFWEVFEELTETEKKSFLWFVSGFQRIPIASANRAMMSITPRPPQVYQDQVRWDQVYQDQVYPEAHTCTSLLRLPLYSNKVAMKVKLREALDNSGKIYR